MGDARGKVKQGVTTPQASSLSPQVSALSPKVCSFTCPEGTQFSHPSLRSGQTSGLPSAHCRASSDLSPQASSLKSQVSALSPQPSSLFLHLPRGHPVQSPFASLRTNLWFTLCALSCFVSPQPSSPQVLKQSALSHRSPQRPRSELQTPSD
jgi:hypothetical protein